MGLDNYPNEYPCKTQGTAILEDGKIDCRATQENGGCPYVTELDKVKTALYEEKILFGTPVYGMFGTDCWYRGKYGNYLLEALGYSNDEKISFYGDSEDGSKKSPASCLELATVIDEAIGDIEQDNAGRNEANTTRILNGDLGSQDITAELRYASWYLKWAAKHANGLSCWY